MSCASLIMELAGEGFLITGGARQKDVAGFVPFLRKTEKQRERERESARERERERENE